MFQYDFVNRYGLSVSQMSMDMFVCHNHNSVLSSFRTYHRIYDKSMTTGATCEPGTAYYSGALEFTPVSSGVCVTRSLVFCVMLCTSLFSFVHCLVCSSSMYGL
jgi:hypothetical protein